MAVIHSTPMYKAPASRFVPVLIDGKLVFKFDPDRGLIEWQNRGKKHIIDLAKYGNDGYADNETAYPSLP
jgi:hypothetical protein